MSEAAVAQSRPVPLASRNYHWTIYLRCGPPKGLGGLLSMRASSPSATDAIECLAAAEEDLSAGDGGRGERFVLELVFDELVEAGCDRDDSGQAFGVEKEDAAID